MIMKGAWRQGSVINRNVCIIGKSAWEINTHERERESEMVSVVALAYAYSLLDLSVEEDVCSRTGKYWSLNFE